MPVGLTYMNIAPEPRSRLQPKRVGVEVGSPSRREGRCCRDEAVLAIAEVLYVDMDRLSVGVELVSPRWTASAAPTSIKIWFCGSLVGACVFIGPVIHHWAQEVDKPADRATESPELAGTFISPSS